MRLKWRWREERNAFRTPVLLSWSRWALGLGLRVLGSILARFGFGLGFGLYKPYTSWVGFAHYRTKIEHKVGLSGGLWEFVLITCNITASVIRYIYTNKGGAYA